MTLQMKNKYDNSKPNEQMKNKYDNSRSNNQMNK